MHSSPLIGRESHADDVPMHVDGVVDSGRRPVHALKILVHVGQEVALPLRPPHHLCPLLLAPDVLQPDAFDADEVWRVRLLSHGEDQQFLCLGARPGQPGGAVCSRDVRHLFVRSIALWPHPLRRQA